MFSIIIFIIFQSILGCKIVGNLMSLKVYIILYIKENHFHYNMYVYKGMYNVPMYEGFSKTHSVHLSPFWDIMCINMIMSVMSLDIT